MDEQSNEKRLKELEDWKDEELEEINTMKPSIGDHLFTGSYYLFSILFILGGVYFIGDIHNFGIPEYLFTSFIFVLLFPDVAATPLKKFYKAKNRKMRSVRFTYLVVRGLINKKKPEQITKKVLRYGQ